MAFMRLENVLQTLFFCAVVTTCWKLCSSQRTTNIKFAAIPDPINVLKNETVEFICEQNANNPFNIKFKGNIVIVENKQLKEGFLHVFGFQMLNPTTGKLTLKHATEEYRGLYKCGEGADEKYALIVDVYTLISSKPICKSSIEIGPYFFEDQIDLIEMNCTSEEGIPQVNMSNHIIQGNKTTDVISISTETTSSHPHPSKTLSFSLYFNSTFNNSVFVCNVSQQLPAPYQSYQGSCSFGPSLFLPSFSVTATPSNVNVSDIKNTTFRCTSNVSEVNLTWTKIPTHWEYDIKESDTSIELNVSDTGSSVYSVDIQCVGYYGDRTITSSIEIIATNNPGRVPIVLLVVMVIVLCLIFIIVVMVYKYGLNVPHCKRNHLNVSDGENSSKNNANDRNTSMNDDIVSPIESQTERSNALDVSGMIANTVYETYTGKDDQNETSPVTEKAKMGKRKGKEIEMIENEIYEIQSVPGEVNSTSIPDAVNPFYYSLSPQCGQGNSNQI